MIKAITPTETYYADPYTNTLYNSFGKEITHGFLRIIAFMLFKNIIAVENANGQFVYCSRKLNALDKNMHLSYIVLRKELTQCTILFFIKMQKGENQLGIT